MIRRNATLAELEAPYNVAERELTALITASPSAERDLAVAAKYGELRDLAKSMQLAVYREPDISIAVASMLRHAVAGLDANVTDWTRKAADWSGER
jgi:hypothetical protein